MSTSPVHAISDDLDILIAFDQETIEVNHHEMREDSIIIADSKAKPVKPENCQAQLIDLPFTSTAKIRYCINEKIWWQSVLHQH